MSFWSSSSFVDRMIQNGQASLAGLLFNWELRRSYHLLSKKDGNEDDGDEDDTKPPQPGFTEVWGVTTRHNKNKKGSPFATTGTHSNPTPNQATSDDPCLVDTSQTDYVPRHTWGWSTDVIVDDNDNPDDDSTTETAVDVILLQHRPAWAEQLALRQANVPHVVYNVPYAVFEVSGPLPCLIDLRRRKRRQRRNHNNNNNANNNANDHPKAATGGPVLIGRFQHYDDKSTCTTATTGTATTSPTTKPSSKSRKNAILEYLQSEYPPPVTTPTTTITSTATTTKIPRPEQEDKEDYDDDDDSESWTIPPCLFLERTLFLSDCVTLLRYADSVAWFSYHRAQSIQSYRGTFLASTTTPAPWFPLYLFTGWFQTWCERTVALATTTTASPSAQNRTTLVQECLAQADEAYHVLERYLLLRNSATDDTKKTYYNTTQILLFDHLLEALANVHLVDLLYERHMPLIDFCQTVWNQWFAVDDDPEAPPQQKGDHQNQHVQYSNYYNNVVNANNVFNHPPIMPAPGTRPSPPTTTTTTTMDDPATNNQNNNQKNKQGPTRIDLARALHHMQQHALPYQWVETTATASQFHLKAMTVPPQAPRFGFVSSSSSSHWETSRATSKERGGGGTPPSTSTTRTDEEAATMLAHRRGDELWLASTAVLTSAALAWLVLSNNSANSRAGGGGGMAGA
ncbi:hypothetical protein ACA910_014833 [Epithemia clementina (nom. ined.)]